MAPRGPSVLIVGAGPTGLTAAVELARRGVGLRIVDRDAAPTPLSKAVGISPRSLDILEPSGVTERLLAGGIEIRGGEIRFEGRVLGGIGFTTLRHRFDFLLSLPQSDTESIMADRLSELGAAVEWSTALAELRPAGDAIEVSLDGPGGREEAGFSHVFGADGVHSRVREQMGVSFDGHSHARSWSIADAEIANWPYDPHAAQLFLHRNGDLGFVIPIGEGRVRAVSNIADALARVHGGYSVSRVLRTDTFHIPVRQAATYQRCGAFIGGDAAHVHSPVGARGMNLGIEDAASFARRLAEDDLDGYTAERRPVGRRWIDLSERVLAIAQAKGRVAVALRNLAFRVVGRVPALQRPLLERVAGLRE